MVGFLVEGAVPTLRGVCETYTFGDALQIEAALASSTAPEPLDTLLPNPKPNLKKKNLINGEHPPCRLRHHSAR